MSGRTIHWHHETKEQTWCGLQVSVHACSRDVHYSDCRNCLRVGLATLKKRGLVAYLKQRLGLSL